MKKKKKMLIAFAAFVAICGISFGLCNFNTIRNKGSTLESNFTSDSYETIISTQKIWEKDHNSLQWNQFIIDKNFKEIRIDDCKLDLNSFLDISLLPNYFFEKGDPINSLKQAYENNVGSVELSTESERVDTLTMSSFFATSMDFLYEDKHYPVIKEIGITAIGPTTQDWYNELYESSKTYDGIGIGTDASILSEMINIPLNDIIKKDIDGNIVPYYYETSSGHFLFSFTAIQNNNQETNIITGIIYTYNLETNEV